MASKLTEVEKASLRRFDKKFNIFLTIVAGIIFFWLGIATNSSVDWFQQNGISSTATVVDAYSKNRIAIYVVQFKIGEKDVTAEIQSDLKVGQKVDILYDPSNPTNIRLKTLSRSGIMFYVGAIICWLYAWAGVSELKKPPSN